MSRVRRALSLFALAALFALAPASAQGAFDLESFDVSFTGPPPPGEKFEADDERGGLLTQAGSHPYAMTTEVDFPFEFVSGGTSVDEAAKDIYLTLPAGFVGNPTAVPRCPTAKFLVSQCRDASALGIAVVEVAARTTEVPPVYHVPVYNLAPPPGGVAKLGWVVTSVPVTLEANVAPSHPNNVTAAVTGISQAVSVLGADVTLWGVPADERHDPLRGTCLGTVTGESNGECAAGVSEVPFLTMPRSCTGPLRTAYRTASWQDPDVFASGFSETHDEVGNPLGQSGCGRLGFGPELAIAPTTASAESAAGLEIAIDVNDEGIANTADSATAEADIAATRFALPRGMTANPSAAEGQGTCSEGQFGSASLEVRGCPGASKLGTLEAQTPVLEEQVLRGSLYLAEQYDNPFGSLLAAYLVIRDAELGVFVKLAAEIETDPESGQIVTSVEDMPPFPLERVRVSLRQGPRAPLITPPECGDYESEAKLTPSSGAAALDRAPAFEIDSGPGGSSCPSGALPFAPGFEAGSANPAAAAYSPFLMRLARQDGEQDLTKFSAVLPPGVTARLAGVEKCSDAALAAAPSREGRAELASPSCPATSQIGRIVAGAGVGTALTYVGGSLHLAGPYNGAPLSVAAIVPAVAGPFDVGTVVTRVGLRLNPKTGQGEVDGAASDPIPHILEGIPLKVRDIEVLADRPDFTLNPTSCEPSNTFATIWGGGSNPFSAADDAPFGAASRFQAASCASLEFDPKLAIKLRGGVKRGAHPALRAIVTPAPGQANFKRAVVTLPRSAFLDQAHIRTICTRVQFAAGPGNGALCPRGAQYGYARAWSPLLDAPAQGPVFLRSSDNKLPDLVVALKGPASAPVDVELSARIDSVRGGIRSTFTGIPDLPVSKFILDMQGAKKGLIVNSRHLCFKPKRNRAIANLVGQNGRVSKAKPRVIATTCQKRRKAKRARASDRRAR